jgi:Lipocalin-like domain
MATIPNRLARRGFLQSGIAIFAGIPLSSSAVTTKEGAKMTSAHAGDSRTRELATLVGAWRLKEWSEHTADGEIRYPLGQSATGQLMYSADGYVAAQLMRPGVPKFAQEDWREAGADETKAAWLGYFGYWGTYSIDAKKHAVVHHIEGSWFPNLLGTDQLRVYKIDGQQLILDADTSWGKVHIVWEKTS